MRIEEIMAVEARKCIRRFKTGIQGLTRYAAKPRCPVTGQVHLVGRFRSEPPAIDAVMKFWKGERRDLDKFIGRAPDGRYRLEVPNVDGCPEVFATIELARASLQGVLLGAWRTLVRGDLVPTPIMLRDARVLTARQVKAAAASLDSLLRGRPDALPQGVKEWADSVASAAFRLSQAAGQRLEEIESELLKMKPRASA